MVKKLPTSKKLLNLYLLSGLFVAHLHSLWYCILLVFRQNDYLSNIAALSWRRNRSLKGVKYCEDRNYHPTTKHLTVKILFCNMHVIAKLLLDYNLLCCECKVYGLRVQDVDGCICTYGHAWNNFSRNSFTMLSGVYIFSYILFIPFWYIFKAILVQILKYTIVLVDTMGKWTSEPIMHNYIKKMFQLSDILPFQWTLFCCYYKR